ncbi:LEAF RUST 10 DISEASE-RESISTANCE LOCUS RECEPTOR-LIKE PROTEIN KINASE-like 2.4 [Lotus japonicus]|uniref:LEAF RUST 10 DISEASE-RESISTANCE LOCUS RECEPTOR-LIKE PROTEIN KINASE-like 2.4 n=1 Tax=Lotus japonicus TaxID=34305 RepID=UPI00258AE491|nr:LEAF RUST 10 DISEASE-RESISTANCE LOCUS RECEPTOR-LIKE PROTEIN KINASE-like 2.4 [Lotus japonicus]
MVQNSFSFILCSPLLHVHIIIFYLLTRTTLCSVDPTFEACEPKTCGNQSISYPFYIEGTQQPFCGYPGFGISCSRNGFPILNLSNTQYIINQIFYENQSIRVSNAEFSRSNTSISCVSHPLKNLTLPSSSVFDLVPNQKNLILFFGCNDLPSLPRELREREIGCSEKSEKASVLALYEGDKNLSFASRSCKGEAVVVTVEDGEGGVEAVLRKGLLLNWTASDCGVCNSTGGRCGFDSEIYTSRCYCADRVHAKHCVPDPVPDTTGKKTPIVTIVALAGAGVAVLIVLACCFRIKNFSSASLFFWKQNPTNQIIEKFFKEHGSLPTARYSYSDVKKITKYFRNKLGQGGFGCVYEGKLCDGNAVAVKILSKLKGDGEEFINEVASIGRTSHVNIVRLLGFCLEGSKRALIYEFMPNGSLEKFIYEEKKSFQSDNQLDCKTLFDIAIGVARGLEYLHRGCNSRILHFDIKPHNILLDENFSPKISDFGLAKICSRDESMVSILGARGTAGYIAPEVFSRNFGAVSHKSDVYSYGMMVLEIVGRRKNINTEVDRSSEIYFPHWIHSRLESNMELGLRSIRNGNDDEIVRKMTIVGLWCIQTNPSNRPRISKVVEMLEGRVELLQIPPKPFLSSPSTSPVHLSCETHHSLSEF